MREVLISTWTSHWAVGKRRDYLHYTFFSCIWCSVFSTVPNLTSSQSRSLILQWRKSTYSLMQWFKYQTIWQLSTLKVLKSLSPIYWGMWKKRNPVPTDSIPIALSKWAKENSSSLTDISVCVYTKAAVCRQARFRDCVPITPTHRGLAHEAMAVTHHRNWIPCGWNETARHAQEHTRNASSAGRRSVLGPETAGGTSPQNAHGADLWSSAPTVLLCVLFCSDTPRHLLRQPQGSHPRPPSAHQQETTICLSAGPYYICYLSSTTRRAHSTGTSKVSAHLSAFLSRALHFPAHVF